MNRKENKTQSRQKATGRQAVGRTDDRQTVKQKQKIVSQKQKLKDTHNLYNARLKKIQDDKIIMKESREKDKERRKETSRV